ncbi:ARM repeat-containing protein [Hanseniaspora valbyensis NRRL Y-1626]|uniref:ARM repeat-containing protein n=1 Tax=Hanseniaspora valbyensis NRRL Y-1626 TaxID=766949 RepID=A0A1B7T9Q1_9ASCO|nr:ARM repeat-containing protein [Hanseniaspora valbyensis NRRL Y-1626]
MVPSNINISTDIGLIGEDMDYYKLSKDQYGCRYLQKQLENDTEDKKFLETIFQKLLTNYQELSIDPFGNYLLQKIVEYLDEPSLELLILELKPNLYSISKNQYGTRSLQKIIDCIYQYDSLCEILINDGFMKIDLVDIVDLINDINGNHVIQKCIFKFKNFHYGFIINAMVHNSNIIKISKNKHGCCVLQKLLSNCNINQMYELMLKILEFDFELINDQFGNYIVQFLLDVDTEVSFNKNSPLKKTPLNLNYILKFMDLENLDLIKLSCLKFSSNVIEKLLIKFFEKLNQYMKITKDVVIKGDASLKLLQTHMLSIIHLFNTNINTLIKDNYGNYTLQTLLDTSNYQNLIERYWNLIEKYKPLENMKDQDKFKLTVNPNGWTDEDIGNNFEEELKLQKTLKFFSDLVKEDKSLNHHDAFIIKFIVEVNDLINSAHGLLGQIKNTSYSKKIKLKLKRYYQEIYHSSNVPKSLNVSTSHRYQYQEEVFNSSGSNSNTSNNNSNNGSNHSRSHSNSYSKNSRSRAHSTSQNFNTSNSKSIPTPKQRSNNNSISSSSNEDPGNNSNNNSNSKIIKNESASGVVLDSYGTAVTTPIEQAEIQGDAGSDNYFDPTLGTNVNSINTGVYGGMPYSSSFNNNSNSNNNFGYDTYQKQPQQQQQQQQQQKVIDQQQMFHQRHFSLPSNNFSNGIIGNQPDNIWAMKNNYGMNNSGYNNNYNFAAVNNNANNSNNRNHTRTNSLVDQASYGRGNFMIPESQQAASTINQFNNYGSGYVSPGSYRTMQPQPQGNYSAMNFNSIDYTDRQPAATSQGGYPLNVGNTTMSGHKKESLSNASNNTTMSANFSNITNMTAYSNLTPVAVGHKSHASVGSMSIGSDVSMPTNNSCISTAPIGNGPWNYPTMLPQNSIQQNQQNQQNQQHMRHSSQGSIWMDGYANHVGDMHGGSVSNPGHGRSGSFPQGFMIPQQQHPGSFNSGNTQKQAQQQLHEPEFVSLSQQYGFS